MFLFFILLNTWGPSVAQNSVPYPSMGMNLAAPGEIRWMNLWNCLNPSHSNYGDKYVFTIANELDKDIWIMIPIKADDDYILQLAKMIKSNLKPTLNVNIELGNEIWNFAGGFHCFGKTKEMCVVYRNSGNPAKTALYADPETKVIDQKEFDLAATYESFGLWTAHERFPAFRLKEMPGECSATVPLAPPRA